MSKQALFTLFAGTPRQGVGCLAVSRKTQSLLPPLPPAPRAADLGCGSGSGALFLTRQLWAQVLAVDLHRPFLDGLKEQARRQGLDHLIETHQGDMAELNLAPASLDLIWCEGSMYFMGFSQGLGMCRPWLKPGGCLAVSELCWLTDQPPAEPLRIWSQRYAGMEKVEKRLARLSRQATGCGDIFPYPRKPGGKSMDP